MWGADSADHSLTTLDTPLTRPYPIPVLTLTGDVGSIPAQGLTNDADLPNLGSSSLAATMSTQHANSQPTTRTDLENANPLHVDVSRLAEHSSLRTIFAHAVRTQTDADLPGGLESLGDELRNELESLDYESNLSERESERLLERGAGYVRRDLEATYADLEGHERLIAKLQGHVSQVRDSRDVTFDDYNDLAKLTGIKEHENEH